MANSLRGAQQTYSTTGVLCENWVEDRLQGGHLVLQKSYVGQEYHSSFKPGNDAVSQMPSKHQSSNIINYQNYDPKSTYLSTTQKTFVKPAEQTPPFNPPVSSLEKDPEALAENTRRWTKCTGELTKQRMTTSVYREFAEAIESNHSEFMRNRFRPGHEGLWH
eukprot:TRINITY_DN17472_c0_g1::TRINITY_DN17472_c0_g1_i1::g.28025::m.28025 TRINITY_DN17472_c0_g1::TRINITY_DN17472_c0_g1_i1::g.28025  ORF type:complete len:190 (-),score=6.68 TRINITY_DN17472_c0_g1_i1:304-792(-)